MNKFRKTGKNQRNNNDKIMYCATDGHKKDVKMTFSHVKAGNAC